MKYYEYEELLVIGVILRAFDRVKWCQLRFSFLAGITLAFAYIQNILSCKILVI